MMPVGEILFYVGRCKICNNPVAAAVKYHADGDDVKDMVDSGLIVRLEAHHKLTIKACECRQ